MRLSSDEGKRYTAINFLSRAGIPSCGTGFEPLQVRFWWLVWSHFSGRACHLSGISTSDIPTVQLAASSIGRYFRLLLSLLDSSIRSGKQIYEKVWLLDDGDEEIVRLLPLNNCDDRRVGRLHLGARNLEWEKERKTETSPGLKESLPNLRSRSDDRGKAKQTTGGDICKAYVT